jgi:hypothetical protein
MNLKLLTHASFILMRGAQNLTNYGLGDWWGCRVTECSWAPEVVRLSLVPPQLELFGGHNRSWSGSEHTINPPLHRAQIMRFFQSRAPANVDMRLSPQPIRQYGKIRLWVITCVQPTNKSVTHPSILIDRVLAHYLCFVLLVSTVYCHAFLGGYRISLNN